MIYFLLKNGFKKSDLAFKIKNFLLLFAAAVVVVVVGVAVLNHLLNYFISKFIKSIRWYNKLFLLQEKRKQREEKKWIIKQKMLAKDFVFKAKEKSKKKGYWKDEKDEAQKNESQSS